MPHTTVRVGDEFKVLDGEGREVIGFYMESTANAFAALLNRLDAIEADVRSINASLAKVSETGKENGGVS